MRWLTTRPLTLEHAAVIWLVRRAIDRMATIELMDQRWGAIPPVDDVEILGPTTKLPPFLKKFGQIDRSIARRIKSDLAKAEGILKQGGDLAGWSPALALAVLELGKPSARIAVLEQCFDQHFGALSSKKADSNWGDRIVQSMPIGTMLLDHTGSVKMVNRRAEGLLAVSGEVLLGKKISAVPLKWVDRNGFDVMDFSKVVDAAIKNRRPYDNLLTKSSEDLFLATSLQPLGSKRREDSRLLITCVDVTDQVLLEQTMATQEKRMHYLLNSLPFSVLEFNADGEVTYANAGTHNMFKYRYGSLVGEPIWFTKADKVDESAVKEQFHKMIEQRLQPQSYLSSVVDRAGGAFEVMVDWNYRIDDGGDMKGFTLTMSSLTSQGLRQTEFSNYLNNRASK